MVRRIDLISIDDLSLIIHIFKHMLKGSILLHKVYPENYNSSYFIIDIRTTQAYLNGHVKDAINLKTYNEIRDFLLTQNDSIKPLLCCFASTRARDMAKKLSDEFDISYLDANLLELQSVVEFESINDEFILKINRTKEEIYRRYIEQKKAWIVAFSGGKDSTCVLQLMYEMICQLPKEDLNPTYAIVSNTLVEAPVVDKYLVELVDIINMDAKKKSLPFEVILVEPEQKEQFWVNLIGKGYPSPTRTFRWCTDRLKIRPTQRAVEKLVSKHKSAILMLGVRKSESSNRQRSIEKRELSEDGFNKHDFYPNTLIYSPIVDWTLEDVWGYLTLFNPAPWGESHMKLFSLYAKASVDECQFILDKNQSSCGGSRFGCWVCTLVNEDKSMQGFIKNGEEGLKPLNEFRDLIKDMREDRAWRSDFQKNGNFKPGPFTKEARMKILRALLNAELEYRIYNDEYLISDEQLKLIASCWNEEFDSEQMCLQIAKEFGRMENVKLTNHKILHEEIFEEGDFLNFSEVQKKLLKSIVKDVIHESNNANDDYYNIVKKYIDDATMKIKDEV